MMEMFFTPYEEDTGMYYASGDRDDACTWKGVTCLEDGTVDKIEWTSYVVSIAGTIEFGRMPQRTTKVQFSYVNLYGEVDMTFLPQTLKDISMRSCFFSGTLDVGRLPPHLESLSSRDNRISGLCNIRNLPQSLQLFEVMEYGIQTSEIHVGKLPNTGLRIRIRRFAKMSFDDPADSQKISYTY